MINCRATHNLISLPLVEKLNMSLMETSNCGIVIGNGTTVRDRGICKGVSLNGWP